MPSIADSMISILGFNPDGNNKIIKHMPLQKPLLLPKSTTASVSTENNDHRISGKCNIRFKIKYSTVFFSPRKSMTPSSPHHQ